MRVYRITRYATTSGDTMYSIERFGLLGYVREVGLVKTLKQFKNGLLSFNPYKMRRLIRDLQKAEMWLYKSMIYGVPIIGDTDMVVKMSLENV